MGITRQSGEFTNSVITVNLADKLEDSTVEVEIDTNSLSGGSLHLMYTSRVLTSSMLKLTLQRRSRVLQLR